MIAAYEQLNRPDLAACVKGGRIYQRLSDILEREIKLPNLNGLGDAFLGNRYTSAGTMEEWREWAMETLKGEERFKRFSATHGDDGLESERWKVKNKHSVRLSGDNDK